MGTVGCCEICMEFKPDALVDIFGGHMVCRKCSDRAFDYVRVQVMKDLFAEKLNQEKERRYFNAGNF